MDSFWFVALGVVVGGILGALAGGSWGSAIGFWTGLALGSVVGGAGGVAWARRLFFRGAGQDEDSQPPGPDPAAPRVPGLEARFKRTLIWLRILVFSLIPPFLALSYVGGAEDYGWPLPAWPPRAFLFWGSFGFIVVVGALVLILNRCPKCRRMLWKALELYQCPHCGVALRR